MRASVNDGKGTTGKQRAAHAVDLHHRLLLPSGGHKHNSLKKQDFSHCWNVIKDFMDVYIIGVFKIVSVYFNTILVILI